MRRIAVAVASALSTTPVMDQARPIYDFGRRICLCALLIAASAIAEAQPAAAQVTYYGGPVVANVKSYIVLWGGSPADYLSQVAASTPNIGTFLTDGFAPTLFDWLSEYSRATGYLNIRRQALSQRTVVLDRIKPSATVLSPALSRSRHPQPTTVPVSTTARSRRNWTRKFRPVTFLCRTATRSISSTSRTGRLSRWAAPRPAWPADSALTTAPEFLRRLVQTGGATCTR